MANLGTLWFGADIDLTTLRQKIQQGNQSILSALKMDYDPASYQQMVSKLKSQLDKENFEIKITANTRNLFGQVAGSNSKNPFNLGTINQQILDQQKLVNGLNSQIAQLRAEYKKLGSGFNEQLRANQINKVLIPNLLSQLSQEKLVLNNLKATRTAYNQSLSDSNKVKRETSAETRQLTDNQMRLNATLLGGIHISTQLGSALSSVFAIDAARQFLRNVVEIGGQLEKQRISMGAIIGDTARANELFGQIKNLAIKSPFGVVELDQYSKQLAAFGIEQSELYDMTKRLADISAGAGQDIGRLALALGHVKSATYLTGITLRQFSMNNIPMLKMLADYYSEVEKRAVSTAEVQKRISKRQVSYEDVIEQIKRMTDVGGQFYNMQEKISESVSAKWKNLRDSLDIMYGEIAESKIGDGLKRTAEILMSLTRNWKSLVAVLGSAASVFGIIRISTLATSAGMAALNAHAIKSAAATTELTTAQRWLNMEMRKGALTFTLFGNKITSFTRLFAYLRLGMLGIANTAKVLMASLMSALPQIAILAGISAIIGAWQRNNEEMENAKELSDQLFERTTEGLKNLKEMMKETGMVFRDMYGNESNLFGKVPGQFSLPDVSKIDYAQMNKSIETWEEFIKKYSATPNLMLKAAYATDENGKAAHTLAEQYKILGEQAAIVAESLPLIGKFGEYLSEAIEESDSGLLDDSLLTDLKNYQSAVKSYKRYAQDLFREHKKETIAAADAARTNKEFAEALKEAGIESDDYASQLYKLAKESTRYKDAVNRANESWRESFSSSLLSEQLFQSGSLMKAEREIEQEFGQVVERLKAKMESSGINPSDLSEPERLALTQAFTDMATKAGLSVDEVTKKVWELVQTEFPNIKLDIDEIKTVAKISAIKEELDKLVGGDFHINIDTATNAFDVIQKIREGYKSAKDLMENAQPILLKMGLSVSGVAAMTEGEIDKYANGSEFVKTILQGVQKAQTQINDALQSSTSFGFSLTDPNKGGKTFKDGKKSEADKQLKEWKEEFRELKEFYHEYRKWAEQVGNNEALKTLRETGLWGQFFDKNGNPIYEINNWYNAIEQFEKKLKGGSVERDKLLFDVSKEKLTPMYDQAKDLADSLLKQLDDEIKKQGKQWNLYKKILDATGDKTQASTIAFGGNISFDNFAEQLRSEIAEALKGTKAEGVSIDELLGMDEKQLKDVYDIFGSVVRKMKELKDVEQQLKEEDVEVFINAIKNAKSLDTELSAIDSKYDKIIAALKKQNAEQSLIDNANNERERDKSKTRWEWFKKTNDDWGRVFANLDKISTQTLQHMKDKLEEQLPFIDDNVEAVKELYQALEKLNGELQERSPFTTIFNSIQKSSRLRQLLNSWGNGSFTPNSKSAKYYGLQKDKSYSREELEDLLKKAEEDFIGGLEGLNAGFKAVQDVLSPVINLFEQLGNSSLANLFSIGSNALGAASQVAGGLETLGLGSAAPWGAAIGAGLSVVSSLFAMHDESLQEEIEASKARQKEMENLTKNLETALERTLGGIYNTRAGKDIIDSLSKEIANPYFGNEAIERFLGKQGQYKSYISKDTVNAVENAEKTKKYYDATYASLLAQRDELKHQMELEEDKKKSDSNAIDDYKQQIIEMDDEIKHFAEDMAKSLYDIDVKSWAAELGDALFEAWQKGESGAEAFKKKASEIMAEVAKNIAVAKLIETAMKPVLDTIISEMERTSGRLDEESVEKIAGQMADVSTTLPDSFNALMDGLNEGMKKVGLTDMKELANETKSATQNGIGKAITEQDTTLWSSYLNAIRADLGVMRGSQAVYLPSIATAVQHTSAMADIQVMNLQQIADNTRRNADAADKIYDIMHKIDTGVTAIKMK